MNPDFLLYSRDTLAMSTLPSTLLSNEDVKVQIDTVEANIRRITSQIDELKRQRQKERRALARLWFMILPVGRLPTELVVQIFEHAVQADMETNTSGIRLPALVNRPPRHPVFPLSQVCSYWRQMVISTPSLWAACSVDVRMHRSKPCTAAYLDGLKTLLHRSAPVPIAVSLACDAPARIYTILQPLWTSTVVEGMASTAPRWKYLKADSVSFAHLIVKLAPGTFSSLERLDLQYIPAVPNNPIHLFLPCPRLRRLTVFPYLGQLQIPWPQLTYLVVHEPSLATCRRILLQCSNLISAKLVTGEWESADIDAPLTVLPFLSTLTVNFIDEDGTPRRVDPFFMPLALPALRTLDLAFESDSLSGGIWPTQEFSAFQNRAPNIAEVTLTNCSIAAADLVTLLRLAPSLAKLNLISCEDCIDDSFLEHFRYDEAQAQPLASRLRQLYWKWIGHRFEEDMFEAAIRSRWWKEESVAAPPGVLPLQKVMLVQSFGSSKEALLDRMQDMVDQGLELCLN
ncbi:hypothetical protein B0H19DRAFT_1089650 [Mycena capillaripes]|nr:hypothetical protein B0H19DRAFT_1089650 [Mycena capillaripes]